MKQSFRMGLSWIHDNKLQSVPVKKSRYRTLSKKKRYLLNSNICKTRKAGFYVVSRKGILGTKRPQELSS